jgi:LPS export ABC transporter protein LptC
MMVVNGLKSMRQKWSLTNDTLSIYATEMVAYRQGSAGIAGSVNVYDRNGRNHAKISTTINTIIIACALCVCAPNKDPIPVGEKVIAAPHQEFTEASLFFYEGSVKRWWLDTDYMSRPLADTGSILVAPVRITIYDSLGNMATRILSDSGRSDSRMEIFDLWGGVHIKNEDGMVVKSEQLKWFKNKRNVTSETYVQVETAKGDLLRGKGLEARDDFSRFAFLADVQGIFPDFRRRLEEQDEDFFK